MVRATLPTTTETASFDRCQAWVSTDGSFTVDVEMYAFNSGGWQFGNTTDMVFRFKDATYADRTFQIAAYPQQWSDLAAGTVAIQYRDNAHPRNSYKSSPGGTITLAGPLLLSDPGKNTVSLAATGQMLSGSTTVTFSSNVEITTVENLCDPYAQGIQRLASQAGCAGSGETVSQIDQNCNDFVHQYVEQASCSSAYEAYLDCASTATMCNPCRSEYCAFDICMCGYWAATPNTPCVDPAMLGCP